MKTICLTQGQVAFVDDEDHEWLDQYNWTAHWNKDTQSFYAVRRANRRLIRMHRAITSAAPDQLVDHANHDTLDNRRCNLRLCNASQNNANQRKQPRRSSRFKGVYWYKACRKWHAMINRGSFRKSLGYFAVEEDAARAYDAAAIMLFGEFACTNEKMGLLPPK